MLLHVYEGLPNLDWQSCELRERTPSVEHGYSAHPLRLVPANNQQNRGKDARRGTVQRGDNHVRPLVRPRRPLQRRPDQRQLRSDVPPGRLPRRRSHKQPASRIQCQLAHRWPCLLRSTNLTPRTSHTLESQTPEYSVQLRHAHSCTEHHNPESRHDPCRHCGRDLPYLLNCVLRVSVSVKTVRSIIVFKICMCLRGCRPP